MSGASAVIAGAVGAHAFPAGKTPEAEKARNQWEVAVRYHLLHSLLLLAVPAARFPLLTGTLVVGGMAMFCGACYATAKGYSVAKVAPFGGTMLIVAWLSLIL